MPGEENKTGSPKARRSLAFSCSEDDMNDQIKRIEAFQRRQKPIHKARKELVPITTNT